MAARESPEGPTSRAIALDQMPPSVARAGLSAPQTWEESFALEIRDLFKKRLRVATAVLLVLHAAAAFVFRNQPTSTLGLVLRIGLVPFTALLFASTFWKPADRASRYLAALMILSVSGYSVWANGNLGDSLDTRNLTLSILTAGLLFPFRGREMLGIAASVLGFYFIGADAAGKIGTQELMAGTFFLVGASILATIASVLSARLRSREAKARHELVLANEKTESLLRNMLPEAIVARLKESSGSVADRHEGATVMFTDIVGFTKMSAQLPPEELVRFLNKLFYELDALTVRYGLEKIKTIGDAYMVAGGLPAARPDHAAAIARLALDIKRLVQNLKTPDGNQLNVRIGIHSGPVIAGVIGATKLTYDLWGDTVNTASRMESHGEPGMIQVSEATYQLLKNEFDLQAKGSIEVKGKGQMNVYLLDGARVPAPKG